MIQTLIILTVISFVMYVFYKVKAVRTKTPILKKWIQTKANISIGVFLASFGANLLLTSRGNIDTVVGSVFLLLGAANIILGIRQYKLYLPYAAKETEEQRLKA